MTKVLPNLLTLSRLALMPVSLFLFANGSPEAAFGLYLFLAFTDYLDGYLARRWNTCSSLGIILDQVSDKLVGLGFFFGLTFLQLCPLWFTLLLILNSLLLGVGYLFSQLIPSQAGAQASLKVGKWSTALQYLWIGWILFSDSFFGKSAFFIYLKNLNQLGFIVLAVLQIWVLSQYAFRMYRSQTNSLGESGTPPTRFNSKSS